MHEIYNKVANRASEKYLDFLILEADKLMKDSDKSVN